MCRVRWNHSHYEAVFATGVYAQIEKWDPDQQKAKKGSIHDVSGVRFSATEINARIAEYREIIETCFATCSLRNVLPLNKELKEMVDLELNLLNSLKAAPETANYSRANYTGGTLGVTRGTFDAKQ